MNEAIKNNAISNQSQPKTLSKTIYNCVVFIIAIAIVFFESIFTLVSIFKFGFLKKEILTTKSDIGFDIIIKNN